MTDNPRRDIDGWRDEATASVVDDLSESGRAALEKVMAEKWTMLRVARLLGLMGGLERRVEALEAEVRSLRAEQEGSTL